MHPFLRTSLWDLLFPPTCLRCGKEGSWCCSSCETTLPPALSWWCPQCGVVDARHHLHGAAFTSALSLLSFQEPWVERALHALKYAGIAAYASYLGTVLAERLPPVLRRLPSTVVTSIPLAAQRERSRGFNQAALLARSFAAALSLPYRPLLLRTRHTATQTTLSAEERRKNVAIAFAPRMDTWRGFVVPPKHVILLDDVITTGATLTEASRVLQARGVERNTALTVAYSASVFSNNAVSWRGG